MDYYKKLLCFLILFSFIGFLFVTFHILMYNYCTEKEYIQCRGVNMTLEKKITRLTIGIFITIILIISIFSIAIINSKVSEAIGKSLTDTAFVVAANPMIQKELSDKEHLFRAKTILAACALVLLLLGVLCYKLFL